MDWGENEQEEPMRLTTRGKILVGALWIAGTGLAGWFAPVGWWL